MPTKRSAKPTGGTDGPRKPPSGAEKRRRAAAKAAALAGAPPLADDLAAKLGLKPPPEDDLQLQLWGARCAATLAYIVLTNPRALRPEQLSLAQRFLTTLGMLFPRSEMVARLERAKKKRERTTEAKDVQPRGTLPPGPGSRRSAPPPAPTAPQAPEPAPE